MLTVPNEAIKATPEGRFVSMMKNGEQIEREVTTGLAGNDFTEITDGLKEGDVVVTAMYTPSAGGSSAGAQAQTGQNQSGNSKTRGGPGGPPPMF